MSKVQKLHREELKSAFFLLLPATIGLLVFSFYSIISAARTSFFDVSMLSLKYIPVGFANYIKAFHDKVFLISIGNTLFYTVAVVLLQVTLALIFALILKNAFAGVGFFRSAIFLPGITSMVVVSTIWKILYHTDVGMINSILQTLGATPVGWLTDANVALWSIVIIGVWKDVGFSMLVLLGGLNVIPSDYYEAASIDGASGWTSFRKITLPLLRRSLLFVTVLATINAIKVFIPIYVITSGGPANSTRTLVFNIYNTVFGYYKLGYGSALSMILLLIVGVVVGIQFRLLRSDVEY